ncbi:MAG: nitroreductase family protein [Nitrososphaerales archaeon]
MVEHYDFLNFIKSRRSIRKLKSEFIPRDIIEEILNVAISAPSAHNAQPWHFIIIDDDKVKVELADSMAQVWQEDLSKDGLSKDEIKRLTEASKQRIINSSILVVPCLTMEDMDKYPDERRKNAEYLMAVQSISAAIQNLLLAIHAKGLGACWRCAPLFCIDAVRKVLKIPDKFEPQALIEIGYPLEHPKMPSRKPLKSVISYNKWR